MKPFFKSHICFLFVLIVLLASCSETTYRQAIPKASTALVSFDASKMSGVNNATLLKALLRMRNLDESGIDLTQKIYLFESPDGNIGICAKVQHSGKLEALLTRLGGKPTKFRDASFVPVGDAWLAGYNDRSLLLMGPLPVSARQEIQGMMAQYLQQDEDHSILVSPLYEKLDSMDSPMAMVAQAQALPEQFVAPMTLGAPKDADASQVLVAAEMRVEKGCLKISGRPFSLNKRINQSIEEAIQVYRPIAGKYIASMPGKALMGLFVNVDGKRFLPLLQNSKGLQVLLTGINQAVDLDNIIRSVDGDMVVVVPRYSPGAVNLSMAAQLGHARWLNDIDYWKQSVPKGGRLTDAGPNTYLYTGGQTRFCFGVSQDLQFFSGSSRQEALASIATAANPLPAQVQQQIKGEKLVMVVRLDDVQSGVMNVFAEVLRPIFGHVSTMVYKLK